MKSGKRPIKKDVAHTFSLVIISALIDKRLSVILFLCVFVAEPFIVQSRNQ